MSAPDSWIPIGNAFQGGGQYNLGVSFVSGDKLYFGLGIDKGSIYNYDFKVYDCRNNTWSQGPQMPPLMKPRMYASSFVLGSQAYVGMGVSIGLADWWRLDIPTGTWSQITSYSKDGYAGVCFVVNNTSFFYNPKDANNLDQFNPAGGGSWTTINSSWPSSSYSSFFTIGNYGYMAGGLSGGLNAAYLNKAYQYDPSKNTITPIADMPVAVHDAPSFCLDNYGYVLFNGTTYRYDPVQNLWADTGIIIPVFSGVYNAAVINGIAYAWKPDGTMYMLVK